MACLPVKRVKAALPENASVIHPVNQDLKQHPALDSAIRGGNRDPEAGYSGETPYDVLDKRTIGSAPVIYVERGVLIESFGPEDETRNRPYLTYDDAYYYFLIAIP